MLKAKVSEIDLNEQRNLYSAGYCELQTTLLYSEPVFYCTGKHGWKYDVYLVGSYYVVSGYSAPSNATPIPLSLSIPLEYKSQKVLSSEVLEYSAKREKLEYMLVEALKELQNS